MKRILAAAALAVALTGAAQAAPVTIWFTAEDLYDRSSGAGLALLGLTPGGSLTGSFTYDDSLPDAPNSYDDGTTSYAWAYDYDSTMSVQIDGATYTGSSLDSVSSRDGITDPNGAASGDYDTFVSYMDDAFNGLAGISDSYGYVQAYDTDEAAWRGVRRT